MHKWIEQVLAEQPHIGLGKALVNFVLEPCSPFESRAWRKPRAAFVLGAMLFIVAAMCLCYFNLTS
jgi:hypothetical protein